MQRAYRMSLVEIGIGLYTYNHSNLSISKFESSMFMISIFRLQTMVTTKLTLMLLYLQATTKLEKKYKIQECILHTTYKLFEPCHLLHSTRARFISQMI